MNPILLMIGEEPRLISLEGRHSGIRVWHEVGESAVHWADKELLY